MLIKKMISCSVLLCLTAALTSGCTDLQPGDDSIGSIDKNLAMDVPETQHIRLTDHQYTLRNDADRSRVSFNHAFSSGYVMKPALFVHPSSTDEYTLVDFNIDLTSFTESSLIILEYSTGIADGVQADGVEFIVMSGEKIIDNSISKESRWKTRYADLSEYFGRKIVLTLGTKGSPTTNYAWAAFGDPCIFAIEKHTDDLLPADGTKYPVNVSGSLTENGDIFAGYGKVLIDSPDFLPADGYVLVSGRGPVSVSAYSGNNRIQVQLINNNEYTEFRYLIPVGSSVIKRSDWDIALGLPADKVTLQPFDYFSAAGRNFLIEIDSEGDYELVSVELWRKPGIIEAVSLKQAAYIERSDSDTAVNVIYRNAGGTIMREDGFGLRAEAVSEKGRVKKLPGIRIPDMAFGSQYFHSFDFGRLAEGTYKIGLFLIDSRGETLLAEQDIEVKDIDISGSDPQSLVIEDDALKLVLTPDNGSFVSAHLFEKKTQRAVGSFALPRFVTEDQGYVFSLSGGQKTGSDKIALTGSTDEAELSVIYEIQNGRLSVTHELKLKQDIKLRAFEGPVLLFGDGSFGRVHENAIFPGIDYLSTESSNNSLAAAYPYSERFAPNPKKVTSPVMLAANEGMVVRYVWFPEDEWAEGVSMPMARFEAPALDGSDYGIMGIFVPSGSQYMKENTLNADNPQAFKKGSEITLKAQIDVLYNVSSHEGLLLYLKEKGLPDVPVLNKEPIEVFEALVKGLAAERIDERGWINFLGLDSVPATDRNTIHTLLTAQHLLDDSKSIQAKEILESVDIPGVSFEWSHADSIYWRMEDDYLSEYYASAENYIKSMISLQREDGTWSFSPANKRDYLFGKPGDVTMGTVAVPAIHLVKAARLTGSKEALEAAQKAVGALADFTKPAGAGPWELPNSSPDALAAFLGLKASLDLYDYTKDTAALETAVKIAKQSLAFVYFTHIPMKPVSAYGQIASFGATNWGRMWQGSPVQWIGAFMAEEYKRLSEYDDSVGWDQIGQGMTAAGINLVNNDRQPGRFPDYVDVFKSDATIYNIWANLAARNVSCDLGFKSEWDQKETDGISVIAGYEITDLKVTGKTIDVRVKVPEGMPCYILIHADTVSEVFESFGPIDLQKRSLTSYESGYRRLTAKDAYVIKITGEKTDSDIKIILG